MNKKELVEQVAQKTGASFKHTSAAVDATLNTIAEALASNEDVRLVGFGTFKVTNRAARTGRNPATGEKMKIGPSKAPVFKPGKELKTKVDPI